MIAALMLTALGGVLMLWPTRQTLDLSSALPLRDAFPTTSGIPADLRALTRRIAGPLRVVGEDA